VGNEALLLICYLIYLREEVGRNHRASRQGTDWIRPTCSHTWIKTPPKASEKKPLSKQLAKATPDQSVV